MIENLQQIPMQFIFMGILIILGGRWLSNKAESTPARLFWVILGLYFLSFRVAIEPIEINLDLEFFLSIGFIMPHVKYFIFYIIDFIQTTIAVTYNLYTLWLTVYYKTRNIFLWVYEKINLFFNNKNYEKTKKEYKENQRENSYYKKQDFGKKDYSNTDEGYDYSKYEKEKKEQSSNSSQQEQDSTSYNTNETYEENIYGTEYNRFYSLDPFTVLGVLESDEYSIVKKAYRKLAMQYHPDRNRDKEKDKMYNDIFQRINNAFEEVEKKKK